MPNPFEDGGTTKTIDIPPLEAEPERKGAVWPWAALIAAVLVVLGVLLVIAIVLAA